MSLSQFFSFKRTNVLIKTVVGIIVIISGVVLVAVIRSPSLELSDELTSTTWEQMFQSTTNAVLLGNINFKQPNCLIPSIDWDALLDSDTLTGPQLVEYFMWTNHSSCKLSHDFGGVMMDNPSGLAGQKAVCIDPEVAPKPGNCLVYSFGINDDWSFDEKMARYGCQVYAFDPSMDMDHHDHSPGNVHFYNWGLGSRDEYDHHFNWTIHSLSSIYKKLSVRHGRRIIDYLKIDIEGSEWDVITEMIASGMLSNVRQLGVEIHLVTNFPLEKYRDYAKLLRSMETMGMVRFDSEFNPWFMGNFTRLPELGRQSQGYEIAWFNANLTRHPTGG